MKEKLYDGEPNNQKFTANKHQCIKWILRAQSEAYETDSGSFYEPSCSELHVLKPMKMCSHCGAIKFEFEPPTFCCDNGRIKLAETNVPAELEDLLTSQSDEAKYFRKNIRVYNSPFSFICFVVNLDKDLSSSRKGVYTFRVQGQVYHDLPGLIPSDNEPRFFQLYFHDTVNEVENRMKIMKDGNATRPLMKKIMKIMEEKLI
ncbi:hypothetical protein LIER_09484 [Lithospermum erythrorhizon]|uniref:Uncharacterized protein n=1 Tax=Lithospermum erythrorhizon TaxID=34254 RepID=A0AAV3PHS6_LITER